MFEYLPKMVDGVRRNTTSSLRTYSSVVSESEFKPKTSGFLDPLTAQSEKQFFLSPASESTLVQTCLFVPDPNFVCTARSHVCAHVKDPISLSVVKE